MASFRRVGLGLLAIVLVIGAAGTPGVAQGRTPGQPPGSGGRLDLYETTVDAERWQALQRMGLDVAHVEETEDGVRVQLVLSRSERNRLRRQGVDLRLVRNDDGLSASQAAVRQAQGGYTVWRSFDEPGGIRDQIHAIATTPRYRGFVQLVDLGDSHQGRDILALRLTQAPQSQRPGRRPAVLYQATAHAREWISTEVNMRLLRWYLEQRAAGNREITRLLQTTELWFIPVVNPDGYQYTFDVERLWRKNLSDNDGNGVIDANDGVDLNRNLPEHWNYDEEGSSSQPASLVYRGPEPASEPETRANMSVFDLADVRFAISYHSFGELLLYPQGWQVQTPTADDPIYVALTGTDDKPAVPGYDPGLSADLYTTNGEFTDWAHGARGVLAWTPELAEGCPGCGFVFPDDEALVQAEFERNLGFALNVARSAQTPDDPVSHAPELRARDLYLDVSAVDPWKSGNPSSDLRVRVSHAGGSTQPVDVLARRSAGRVSLHYSINGGPTRTRSTSPRPDGEVFGGNNAYTTHYHYLRGEIPGLSIGDAVTYWFTTSRAQSPRQPFTVVDDADADVLIVAHEDRTGLVNIPGYASTAPSTPNYLAFYTAALEASGHSYDVWDIDAMERRAPDPLGVLSHYDAVVWYSGNNLVTRRAGRTPGNIDRLANDLILAVRAHLNDGGAVLYTGQWAGAAESGVAGNQFYDPVADEQCVVGGALVLDRCQLFSDKDDFLQYYLGAYLYSSDGGTDPGTGDPFPLLGVAEPYMGMAWTLNGGDSAGNQGHTATFLTTSSLLPPDTYPQFTSHAPAAWDTGVAGGFEPYHGSWYVHSGMADVGFKRLSRIIDLTGVTAADAPTLTFRFSYDTEADWDYAFVEAHTVGQDDWTTLPEVGGRTSSDTGDSCPSGWHEIHPWLERYQGEDCSGANASTGAEWHAVSGRSAGWEPWTIDLSAYAGGRVEVAISYASDWAVQGLGAFVDHVELSTEPGVESFETGLGAWAVPGPPAGSSPNANDWVRTESVGFEEGAATATRSSLYLGFGIEGVSGAETRAALMGKSIAYLLSP
jgi:hypothetical protein